MPKPQGSPSADFRGFLVGLLYPWLVGVNSPVSPSWGLPFTLSASTYSSAAFTLAHSQATSASQGLQGSSRGQDEQLATRFSVVP